MSFDDLKDLLESIQAQIRSFDSKAQVLLGVNGLLAGFITAELAKGAEFGTVMPCRFIFLTILLGLSVISTLISFGYALRVLNPQLHLKQPNSYFFFCHLADRYGRDYERAARELIALDETSASQDVSKQVLANAIICNTKAKRCKWGMRFAAGTLFFYALSIPVFVTMAYSSHSRTAEATARVSK